jgi:hypothetical protein
LRLKLEPHLSHTGMDFEPEEMLRFDRRLNPGTCRCPISGVVRTPVRKPVRPKL